jgi:hypothetical protein
MPTKYLTDDSVESIQIVQKYMREVAKVDIDLNTAIGFLFNAWLESVKREGGELPEPTEAEHGRE